MGVNALNEYGADGSRETNFRRDVRQALDMHPMDRDHQILAEIKRIKKFESEVGGKIALAVIKRLEEATADGKITRSQLAVQLGTHVVLEAVATALDLNKDMFKKTTTIGQPGAYFV